MNWPGPTFTDSGGFQVMSLGAGFKKVLAMDVDGMQSDDVIAAGKTRLATVDDDGVTFTSHLDGSLHRFTPEVSMQIQHQLGADIIFAFDELHHADEHPRLPGAVGGAHPCLGGPLPGRAPPGSRRSGRHRPYQALFGVVQGAQYEDLRRQAARGLAELELDGRGFDGFGIGGALEKHNLGTIVRLGVRGTAGGQAAAPAGHQRTGRHLHRHRERRRHVRLRLPVPGSPERRHLHAGPAGTTSTTPGSGATSGRSTTTATATPARNYTRAYLHHLFRAKEMLSSTLSTIHNERFVVRLVDRIRASIDDGTYQAVKAETLGRYYAG